MTDSAPTVFSIRKDGEKTKLYLGEYTTRQGLQLFDQELKIKVDSVFAETRSDENNEQQEALRQTKTVGQAVDVLAEDWWPYDFSCSIDDSILFSSHDDGECTAIVPSNSVAKELVLRSVSSEIGEAVWAQCAANFGCYVAASKDGAEGLSVFKDFDSYLKSRED